MKIYQIERLLAESVAEVQQQQIDAFLQEFASFNVKEQKKRLKTLTYRLQELNHHVNNEMFNESDKYTLSYSKLKNEIKELESKILRYEQNKDMIDTFARTHKQYVLKKYGKIV